MPWIVRYEDAHDEDRNTSSVFKSERNALVEATRIISDLVKEELEGIEWEEGDEILELLNATKSLLAASKGPHASVDALREAYDSWGEYVSESGNVSEDVTVEEADRGDY